jgi:hypothetical protein
LVYVLNHLLHINNSCVEAQKDVELHTVPWLLDVDADLSCVFPKAVKTTKHDFTPRRSYYGCLVLPLLSIPLHHLSPPLLDDVGGFILKAC